VGASGFVVHQIMRQNDRNIRSIPNKAMSQQSRPDRHICESPLQAASFANEKA
jgi:hypothetical protein